ncbi:MAG: Wzz/FepE/Etk N-terminal domain-containing protein [Acidobacteriota bacterium]
MSEERERPEDKMIQPAYVLAPGYYPDWEPESQVSLADYIKVLWRRRVLISVGTVGLALAAFFVSVLLPKKYEASATLLVQAPVFATELRAEPFSVETYQEIVNSDYVRSAVKKRLVDNGDLKAGEGLGQLSTEIFTSKLRQGGYTPVIRLVVRANSPDKAELAANAWAEASVQETSGLANQGKKGVLDFIQREYPSSKQRLTGIEEELKTTQDKYDRRIRDLEDRWDRRITAFKTEWNLDVMSQQTDALEKRLTENVVALNDLQLQIKETKDSLDQLKAQIQGQPQFLTISKAITNDALWLKIGTDPSGAISKELQGLKLHSEVLNPVYQTLLQRLVDTQVQYETLRPQEQHVQDQIAAQRKEIRAQNELLLTKQMELSRLTRDRATELALLKREQAFQVGQLQREVDNSQSAFKTLAEKWEVAKLAQAEEDQDVKIGARAVAPSNAVSPRPMLNAAIGLVVGLMLSVVLAFVAEFVQTGSLNERSPGERSSAFSPVTLRRET